MSSPKVSVIVPAYNSGDLVRRAIESACAQTYEDYEIVVVDDGSTDDTWDVIQQAAEAHPKVRSIRAAHAGLAAARNRAIAEMRGEWIALLDADDVWVPEKLHRCMDYLGEHPELSIVYTPMDPVRADGRRMKGHSKACHSGPLTEKLFHSIFIHDPAAVFHKRVIEECGPFDESLPVCVGHEFWLRVSTKFEFGPIGKGYDLEINGKYAVVVGRSGIVGKPMALLLLRENATVTVAHSRTPDLAEVCRSADILCAAVGKADLIKGDWIKPGAVVIDFGVNFDDQGKMRGDVDYQSAAEIAGWITPVPGGTGPMTNVMLMRNLLAAAERQVGS